MPQQATTTLSTPALGLVDHDHDNDDSNCRRLHAKIGHQPASPEHCALSTVEADSLSAELVWTPKSLVDCGHNQGSSLPRCPFAFDKVVPSTALSLYHQLPRAPNVARPAKRRRVEDHSHHSPHQVDFIHSTHFQHSHSLTPPDLLSSQRSCSCLPASLSNSEVAARMLSKNREESSVKTVTLARGTFNSLGTPGSYGVSGVRNMERPSLPPAISPEARDKNDSLRLLESVSIVELLEQDRRPTFIVDAEDAVNYVPESPSLQILFANAALRSDPALLELVIGKPESKDDKIATRVMTQFRGWLLSNDVQGDMKELNPPSIEHGGIVWTCCILKRLRVISGVVPTETATNLSSTGTTIEFSIPSVSSLGGAHSGQSIGAASPGGLREWQDYFGNSVPSMVQEELTSSLSTSSEHLNCANVTAANGGHAQLQRQEAPRARDHDMGFFDWTRLPLNQALPKHIAFARSIDWASTPLGPIEYWSNDLRAMCNLIMASPHPAAMYWGEELVAIYNEAYIGLAGQKHPSLMGQQYQVAWAEIWDDVKEVFTNARLTGQATMKDDDCLFMKRNGFLEETYFSWSIIPMVGQDGTVMGLYNPAFEKTRRKIAERRMLTLREVGERTATARAVQGFWDQVLLGLTENEFDTPFVMLYSVNDENDSDASSIHSSSLIGTKHCLLEGSLGVPIGHLAAPESIDLHEGQEGFGPVFREVLNADKPVVKRIGTQDLSYAMMEGLEWRGFGDSCRDVVICPIRPTTVDTILGFLVMGVNPRRPYDDDYNLFVQLLSRQLGTSLASVVLFEEEIRRGQKVAKLAAEDKFNLSEQLAARTQEVRESETRFTRMAEYSPAGLFIADHAGKITYCNDTWYEISKVPRDLYKIDKWMDYVKEEDQGLIHEQWTRLVENASAITIEFRFQPSWEDRNHNRDDIWVLFSAFPEKDDSGMLKSVFGSITNISPQKWAEGFQKRKMEEAVELKRQQENFIDITSHEMRNPLSAILQCADEITSTLGDFRLSGSHTIDPSIIADSIDAAQTIALCAQHQKRIVDDVLTMSKLDSAMLMVTPVDAQPLQVVQRALKMFEGEVQTAGIHMEFVLADSFNDLKVDWVKFDPSRVLQVLINLTTNAIKFTTTEETRTIKVILSASRDRPSAGEVPAVDYFPMRTKRADQILSSDWGDGEEIYLEFAVRDTGRGLTPEEKKILFQRFKQASPRTHVTYGGSGLGLFISRELTELQGGEIGVSSEAGVGSTFAFYVKCRRSSEPQDQMELMTTSIACKSSNTKSKSSESQVTHKIKDFATLPGNIKRVPLAQLEKRALKVLIVEDNLVNQKVLERQLNNHGIETTVANHGGEALESIKTSTYWKDISSDATEIDVLLMDKEMPVMDGLQCTSVIREMEQAGKLRGHVPIIAVTANARSEQIATLLAAGMDDVVSKPFRIGELIPKIEELAGKYPTSLLGGEIISTVFQGAAEQLYNT